MVTREHWEQVYQHKLHTKASWFQKHATLSIGLIQTIQPATTGAIIDIGGGSSTLVDDLLAHHYTNITVLDISAKALQISKERLADKAGAVTWIESSVLNYDTPVNKYDVWHDRATFHFLTSAKDRQAYVNTVVHAVKPGGHVILATFTKQGPAQCSGLPVIRYDANDLQAALGKHFILLKQMEEIHTTPDGKEQPFIYCLFKVKHDIAMLGL